MKAAVLGAGGLGRTIALELSADRRVSEIVLMDRRGDRSRALQSIGRTVPISALQADVTDGATVRRALQGVDVAVNATLPEFNLQIMKACLEVGCGYVDTSAASPIMPGEKLGIHDQLALDDAWRSRGLTAIVGMGSDPGVSNVMARMAADRLARIDTIRIRWATSGTGVEGFPLYSREIFLRDALSPPVVWDGKQVVEHPPASGVEDFEFPPPIGTRKVHLFRHEEVTTLPLRLGKPVGWVDYKHAIDLNLVRAITELNALGLLGPDRHVKLGDRVVTFRDAFLAAFPEPSTLIGPLTGTLAIVVEIGGAREDGTPAKVRVWTLMDHKEANRRRGTTAEYFLTAAAAASAMVLIGEKRVPRPGVLSPEELAPDLIRPELESRGIRFEVADLPP